VITDYTRYRIYEMLPGLSVWGTLVLAFFLSWRQPMLVIYFIILFDIYWVLKVANFAFYLTLSWSRLRTTRAIDWNDKMRHELTNWQPKRHIIFLTVYNEPWNVVQSAIESICRAVYQKDRFVLVVAGEAREQKNFETIMAQVKKTYTDCFGDVVGILHPADLPGEIPGKGSNLHYAERRMKQYVDERNWAYEEVIATVFDIDTVCHPQYFSYLTYLYCTHPNPTRSSYQPIALYNNNMWESPAPLRVMAFGTTFWIMTSLARQDSLVTFSSHSMSMRALVDAGFHEKRIVSEDSRIFYQAFLAYNGEYEVTPMYIPVSMDTVRDDKWWVSVKNLYKQQRRWAWGAEHVPYLLWEFRKKGRHIPWWKKVKWVFVEWEGKWSWCLIALIITIIGRLPLWLAGDSVRQSALFFNAPHTLEYLINISLFGLFFSAILSFPLLPKRPQAHPPHQYVIMLLQWVLLPISLIFMGAIPAIDAITRLMFGKYLGFNVSQKKRSTEDAHVVSSGEHI